MAKFPSIVYIDPNGGTSYDTADNIYDIYFTGTTPEQLKWSMRAGDSAL